MLYFVISCVLHCIMSFFISYCFDTAELWTPHGIKLPELNDLDDNCSTYIQQRYVNEVILPSYDYFQKIKCIEDFHDDFYSLMCRIPTLLLVTMSFLEFDLPRFLGYALGIVIPSLLAVAIHLIYKRTGLKLKPFPFRLFGDAKLETQFKKHGYYIEFRVSETAKQNIVKIELHHEYVARIYPQIASRYKSRIIVATICVMIFLFVVLF